MYSSSLCCNKSFTYFGATAMREFSGTWMRHSGDFWGGFAAMLVALPAAVAFGVTV